MPANQSSAIIPHPCGHFSAARAGHGFTISKMRKSMKPTNTYFHPPPAKPSAPKGKYVIICPLISSITICPGSLFPKCWAASRAAQTPVREVRRVTIRSERLTENIPTAEIARGSTSSRGQNPTCITEPGNAFAAANATTSPPSDPHVPGATGKYPSPNPVAIHIATLGFFAADFSVCSLIRNLRCGPVFPQSFNDSMKK